MNNLKIFKRIVFLSLSVISLNSVNALSLKIDTSKIYKDVKAGQAFEGVINIINEADTDLKLVAEIEDLKFIGDGQKTSFAPFGTLPDSCARWIQLTPKQPVIAADSSLALKYTITVPEANELKFAEYYAVIFVSSLLTEVDAGSSIGLGARTRIGVLVKIRITDTAKPAGEITDFKALPVNDEEEENTLLISYQFKNSGNVLQKVKGQFSVIDENGSLYGRGMLLTGTAKPGELISIETPWDGELDAGVYDLIAEFRFDPDIIDIREQKLDIIYDE